VRQVTSRKKKPRAKLQKLLLKEFAPKSFYVERDGKQPRSRKLIGRKELGNTNGEGRLLGRRHSLVQLKRRGR